MTKPDPRAIADAVAAWTGIALSEAQARAMAAEAAAYADVTAPLSQALLFDDEPSNLRHALAGRRNWRGAAR